jgi:hypothetical protein
VIAVNLVAMLSAVLFGTLPKSPVSSDAPVLDEHLAVEDDEPSHRLATTVRRWMIATPAASLAAAAGSTFTCPAAGSGPTGSSPSMRACG